MRAVRLVVGVVAVVAVLAAGAAVWWGFGRRGGTGPPPAERHLPNEPRLAYAGPYRNVRPGVKYVGSAACAECHDDKAATYRDHPMGRSIVPTRKAADRLPYGAAHNNPFEAFGSRFFVERDGDRVTQHRSATDAAGRTVYDFALDADYAVGSGTRGFSYVCARDGYLFQTPISWFAQKERWDVSPGFRGEVLAGRPLRGGCLFCHVNRADPVEASVNHYPGERFDGLPIGCERCHGPGEPHVAARRIKDAPPDPDDTIVNPGRLPADLRDAVCEQCHLEGEGREPRRGRGLYDYRLEAMGWHGEALAAYRTVLAGAPGREVALADGAAAARAAGQRDLALDLWKRAVAVNPWVPKYRAGVATLLAERQAWDELGPAWQGWMRLDPARTEARVLWVTALLHAGRKDEARKAFDDVRALRPLDLDRLEAWFRRECQGP